MAGHPGHGTNTEKSQIMTKEGLCILIFQLPSPFYSVWDPSPHNSHSQLGYVFSVNKKIPLFLRRHTQCLVSQVSLDGVTLATDTNHHPICPSPALDDSQKLRGHDSAQLLFQMTPTKLPTPVYQDHDWQASAHSFIHKIIHSHFQILTP